MEQSCNNHEVSIVDTPAAAVAAPAKKSKKPLVITLIIVGAVLTLVVEILAGIMLVPAVINYVDGYPSEYTDPVVLYYDALYKGDVDNVWQMAPAECWAKLAKQTGMSRQECVGKAVNRFSSSYKHYETVTNGYSLPYLYSYTITEKTALTEEQLNKIAAALEEEYGINSKSVTEGYKLRVEEVFGLGISRKPYTVIKIGRKWYIVREKSFTHTDLVDPENSYSTYTVTFHVENYVSVDD